MHKALQSLNVYRHFVTMWEAPLPTTGAHAYWAVCKCGELSITSEFYEPITKRVADHLGDAGEPQNYFRLNKEGATGM